MSAVLHHLDMIESKIKGDKGYTLRKNAEANTVKIMFDLYAYDDLSLT